jgi:hypothetical protein
MPKEVEGPDRLGIRLLLPAFRAVVSLEPAQLFRRRDPDLCQRGLIRPHGEFDRPSQRPIDQVVPDRPLPLLDSPPRYGITGGFIGTQAVLGVHADVRLGGTIPQCIIIPVSQRAQHHVAALLEVEQRVPLAGHTVGVRLLLVGGLRLGLTRVEYLPTVRSLHHGHRRSSLACGERSAPPLLATCTLAR